MQLTSCSEIFLWDYMSFIKKLSSLGSYQEICFIRYQSKICMFAFVLFTVPLGYFPHIIYEDVTNTGIEQTLSYTQNV